MEDLHIYIHVPFCDHKCIYCDFYSIVNYENKENYLISINKEIDWYAARYGQNRVVRSVFFGGGTPSFMEPEYIGEILDRVKLGFTVAADAEITMETNPGTVDAAKLRGFYEQGINRLSIGIQSFNNDELEFLTRIHSSETAIDTVNYASEAGFENVSIDLIFNLPGQSPEKWKYNLETALSLPVKHISAYSLILENGTILNKMVLDGKVKMQAEEYDAELYELTIDLLGKHGFRQYEVSNFAVPGYESVHNNAYWRYREYIGFGPSAHSFMEGKRWANYSSLNFYISNVLDHSYATASEEILTPDEKLDEYVMLALRSRGIDKNDMNKRFGKEWLAGKTAEMEKLKKNNLIDENKDYIWFTRQGYMVADDLISGLLK